MQSGLTVTDVHMSFDTGGEQSVEVLRGVDLSVDPGESKDLSKQQPELRQRLIAAWKDYAKQVGVIAPNVDRFAKE